jgi:hypothetical protein
MNCPMETPGTAELLLDYCARKLNPESTAILERHFEICPSCRSFAEGQRAVWKALDSYAEWDAPPVSADFDRRLYERIEEIDKDVPWWDVLVRPLRVLTAHRGIAAAAACVLIAAGVLFEQQPRRQVEPVEPAKPTMAVVDVQPEQVEQALNEMDMLSEFSHKARTDANSKL